MAKKGSAYQSQDTVRIPTNAVRQERLKPQGLTVFAVWPVVEGRTASDGR